MVSCWADVMMLASTRNCRFCVLLEGPHTALHGESHVLDVSKRPVHHGISEAVRHVEYITTLQRQYLEHLQSRDTAAYLRSYKEW
jgi:hypothetical protein